MPLDPGAQRFLRLLAVSQPAELAQASPAERRAGLADLMKFGAPPAALGSVEDCEVDGAAGTLRARLYTPLDGVSRLTGALVYFHGGGCVAGSIDTHDSIARALAAGGHCRVVAVDYRLAPEHPFPAAVDDAIAAVKFVGAHAAQFGIDRSRLGICGDSAGATLAAAASIALAGKWPLALQVLICPILDYEGRTPSRQALTQGYLIDEMTLLHDLQHYLPADVAASDPRVSPWNADRVDNLPRTLLHTAEFDPLRDEGAAFAERLSQAGCQVLYTCHPGMIHLFYGLGGVIPAAVTAVARIGAEIREALALRTPLAEECHS